MFIKDPANFLTDSGLLFEINRRVLHPLGLALAVEGSQDSEKAVLLVLDCRNDPEGLIFEDETLAEGQEKLEKFLAGNHVQQRLMVRRTRLGYVVQSIPPEPEPPFSGGRGA